ncbi:hypothetical protein R1sor_027245 [Riccia sorocarpa]|uniref:Uncharacterized protein n=1 Tax=Riccia sorocarpa TaxID=122646 RepID=A0ABD3GDM8_9MARC
MLLLGTQDESDSSTNALCIRNHESLVMKSAMVLFPGTKDQTWRWQTSNGDYGKFYLALSSEALGVRCRQYELHAECNKKCEALSRQLYELKTELERLRTGARLHSPPGGKPGCRFPTNHNGDCDFAARAREPCDDVYHTTHDIDYNGGSRTEPQILEDHLKADHPRLVKKVQSVNPLGSSCFQQESGRKGESTPDGEHGHLHPPGSTGSGTADSGSVRQHFQDRTPEFGGGSYVRGPAATATTTRKLVSNATNRMADNSQRPATAPKERTGGGGVSGGYKDGNSSGEGLGNRTHHGGGNGSYPASQGGSESRYAASGERDNPRYLPHDSLKSSGPTKKILPPSQRYNFYRYYGFAGQGAKTSRGWNPK